MLALIPFTINLIDKQNINKFEETVKEVYFDNSSFSQLNVVREYWAYNNDLNFTFIASYHDANYTYQLGNCTILANVWYYIELDNSINVTNCTRISDNEEEMK